MAMGNSSDPDQIPRSAPSDHGLQCKNFHTNWNENETNTVMFLSFRTDRSG